MRIIPIAEIMTADVVSVRDDASLTNIDWEMALAEVRHVPVVDARGAVVGIVSDRDLLRSMNRGDRSRVPVSAIMSASPATVSVDAPAREALEIMLAQKIHAVPVVDAAGTLAGIVTATDFLNLTYCALHGLPLDGRRARA